jgi:hypothetical protein
MGRYYKKMNVPNNVALYDIEVLLRYNRAIMKTSFR